MEDLAALFSKFGNAPEALPTMDMAPQQPDPAMQKSALDKFDAPMPGESLTAEPGAMQYERPPDLNTDDEVMDFLFEKVSREDTYVTLMRMIDVGLPIVTIADQVLLSGASAGKWSLDVAMLTMEPLVLMLATLATRAGINPTIMEEKKKTNYDPRPLGRMLKKKKKMIRKMNKEPDVPKKEIDNLLGFKPKGSENG